jgi:hypothetical protein
MDHTRDLTILVASTVFTDLFEHGSPHSPVMIIHRLSPDLYLDVWHVWHTPEPPQKAETWIIS